MGQYYYPILKLEGQEKEVFSRDVDGEYTMAKLTEHSWWLNPLMKAMGNKLYKQKGQLIWLGDYAEQQDFDERKIAEDAEELQALTDDGVEIESAEEFSFDNKYLCNHTTKEYLDLNKFYRQSVCNGWCLCPLSLLTALGNGKGGGDYCGSNEDKVGIWAWDIISIEDSKPKGYKKFSVVFKETDEEDF